MLYVFMKRIFIILCICFVITVAILIYLHFFQNQKFQTIFLNIGQGDSALIKFSNGEKMLIDCGPDKNVLAKLGKYLPFYDRTLDYLVISHFDLDHYGGCVDVLKRYQVKNIITNGSFKDDSYWQSWDKIRESENANEFVVASTSSWKMGDSKVEFLWPISSQLAVLSSRDENIRSIVLRISNNFISLLFTGDLPIEAEKVLISEYCITTNTTNIPPAPLIKGETNQCSELQSKILKVGHHGSDTSSSDEWLQAISPQTVIISVGKNNFGHPSLRVLRRLERLFVQILRTDSKNDIVVNNN